MNTIEKLPFRVALFSMPWSIFNRPSIQLAALKGFLEHNSLHQADCFHPYVQLSKEIGTEVYGKISLSGWAGEAVFAALAFPEKKAECAELFASCLRGKLKPLPDFETLLHKVENICNSYLQQLSINQYNLFGFSLCFSQLASSLYLAQKLKQIAPLTPIVFGGSSCSGDAGKSLVQNFPIIDYLIDGEGEVALVNLCNYLLDTNVELFPNVYTSKKTPKASSLPSELDLNKLPPPDYQPYFNELKTVFPDQPFIPVLPLEFSRGCWWNKCSFCNLNLQWKKYRHKDSSRMEQEAIYLTKKYETLQFTFTDNALPPREADLFFSAIAKHRYDFDFFAEIRSISNPKRLATYRKGGLKTAQVGIEALSTSILKKLVKGTSVMDNITVMKLCCAYNIRLEGNLIIDFPSTTPKEIAETVANLSYVLPYAPLQTARFFLGYGSPIQKTPGDFGVLAILPHPNNLKLFPHDKVRSMTMLLNSYRGDKQFQKKQWKPVRDKIMEWQKFHKKRDNRQSPLGYRDGGNFLIIRQEKIDGSVLLHRLRGLSRRVYLHCNTPQTIKEITQTFPQLTEQNLRTFFKDMSDKKLIFQEEDRVLSLAIHQL